MHTQRTDSWVALLETGSLKVSPALEGSPGHHPSHLEAPSVSLPDRKQEGPPPPTGSRRRRRKDSPHGNRWRGPFQLKKNLCHNGAVQQRKWAVS